MFLLFASISVLLSTNQPVYPKTSKSLFIFEGELKHEATITTISKQKYISVNNVAKAYGLSVSFRPVSGKVILRGLNKRIEFILNSTKYTVDGTKKRCGSPITALKNTAYIPVDFILSKDFADFTETDTSFVPETSTFIISLRHNIIPPRYYTESDKTKILIETKEKLPWSQKFADGKLTVEFPRGKAIDESVGVNDGVVREIKLFNKNRIALVTVYLTENAGTPVVEAKSDNILVITVPRAMGMPPFSVARATVPPIDVSSETVPMPELPLIAPATQSGGRHADTKPQPQPVIRTATKRIKIVLDAGHGGEDPGAIGPNGTMEKDINLAVARELARLFEEDKNIEIILTRKDDTFIHLVDRTNIANESLADLFISIHCNASLKKTAQGFEVYFLSETASDPDAMATQILENSVIELEKKKDKKTTKLQELLWSMIVNEFINESSELCYLISQEVPKRIKVENRGVKQAGFYVLRGAQMPAVLVECAFLSNHAEEIKLRNPRIQKQIADGLYVAIKNYIQRKKLLDD